MLSEMESIIGGVRVTPSEEVIPQYSDVLRPRSVDRVKLVMFSRLLRWVLPTSPGIHVSLPQSASK